jgi:REP element-mobilizing transposase RayT
MQVLKQRFGHQVLKQLRQRRSSSQSRMWLDEELWQRRFYDFNVWTRDKRIEKLRYMHRNPVKEDWCWRRSGGPGAASGDIYREKLVR